MMEIAKGTGRHDEIAETLPQNTTETQGAASLQKPQRRNLVHALHIAEENEKTLRARLHRVHDTKGLDLLRRLREHIRALRRRTNEGGSR